MICFVWKSGSHPVCKLALSLALLPFSPSAQLTNGCSRMGHLWGYQGPLVTTSAPWLIISSCGHAGLSLLSFHWPPLLHAACLSQSCSLEPLFSLSSFNYTQISYNTKTSYWSQCDGCTYTVMYALWHAEVSQWETTITHTCCGLCIYVHISN